MQHKQQRRERCVSKSACEKTFSVYGEVRRGETLVFFRTEVSTSSPLTEMVKVLTNRT
jgi:hypothetical protein